MAPWIIEEILRREREAEERALEQSQLQIEIPAEREPLPPRQTESPRVIVIDI